MYDYLNSLAPGVSETRRGPFKGHPSMNVFQRFGIEHLSASQITTFASDPSYWYAQKVLGMRTPSNAAMERGRAAENAVSLILAGGDINESIDVALSQFDEANRFGRLAGDCDKERGGITGMVLQAVDVLSELGKPNVPEKGGQHKIEVSIRFGDEPGDTIPIIGFLDFDFDDCIIDLKTTFAVPSTMKWNHRCQAAIYQRVSGNKAVKFLYVSPKKSALLMPEDVAQDQETIRQIVKRMARLLSLGDKDTIRDCVPVIMDSWSWKGLEHERKKYLGF